MRREILLGILHCDLIGFHTYDYVRHFLSSCARILGLPTFPNGADFCGRRVQVRTYPIGIEPEQFEEALCKDTVRERIAALARRFAGVKIIVGVDRLDYIKGLPQKLQGLETFFEEHPDWIGRTVLVQIAVPSRQDVEEYQNLRATVNETVGRINGRFGTVESLPIHLLYRSVNFDELCALYAVSDVCLVTSTRDGMNLVSYEYVACQQERNGVMVLSEFAGAAQSLNGSLIVNPWDRFAVADAIHQALTMNPEARRMNSEKLMRYVKKHTASWWGRSFVEEYVSQLTQPRTGRWPMYHNRACIDYLDEQQPVFSAAISDGVLSRKLSACRPRSNSDERSAFTARWRWIWGCVRHKSYLALELVRDDFYEKVCVSQSTYAFRRCRRSARPSPHGGRALRS